MGRRIQERTDRIIERITRAPLKGAWLATAAVVTSVTVLAGLLIRVTDSENFSSVWEGLWWAAQTTTTVGYGDLVPTSTAGRLIAVVVMVAGIGFITVSTAAIASAFVEASRRRRELANAAAGEADDNELRRIEDMQRAHGAQLASMQEHIAELTRELRRLTGGAGEAAR